MSKTSFTGTILTQVASTKVAFNLNGLTDDSVMLGGDNAYGGVEAAVKEARNLQNLVKQSQADEGIKQSVKIDDSGISSPGAAVVASERSKNTPNVPS